MIASKMSAKGVALTISGLAWCWLLVWNNSSFAAFLDHGDWTTLGVLSSICAVDLSLSAYSSFGLVALSWMLMVVGMMLPAAVPLVRQSMSSQDSPLAAKNIHTNCGLGIALAGYVLAWFGFGLFAHGFGYILNELISLSIWWSLNGWVLATIIFAAAGLYQHSATKAHFLKLCCNPQKLAHNHLEFGRHSPKFNALVFGLRYGFHCIGCCGFLMLLMFVLFPGSLAAMFFLMLLMLADRSRSFDVSLKRPIGFGLIALATATAVVNITSVS